MLPTFSRTDSGTRFRIWAIAVTDNFFPMLGVRPFLGRVFTPQEKRPGADRVVMLDYDFWRNRFNADKSVLGSDIHLDGDSFTIIGVLPATFRGTTGGGILPSAATNVWLPYRNSSAAEGANRRDLQNVGVLGRLKPNVSWEQANAEVERVTAELGRVHPSKTEKGAFVAPARETLVAPIRPTLTILLCAVGLVLLICWLNAAGLLLFRHETKRREMAIRRAIGAGRAQIVRKQFLESSVPTLLGGGILGLLVCWALSKSILALAPSGIPRLDTLAIDGRTVLFHVVLILISGITLGLVGVRQGSKPTAQVLRGGGIPRSEGGGTLPGAAIVACEVALATILIVGAGLLLSSFHNLLRVDSGFEPGRVLTTRIQLDMPFVSEQWPRSVAFFRELIERVEALPGVVSVAAAYNHPLSRGWEDTFRFLDNKERNPEQVLAASYRPVTPGYFKTAGIPIKSGRSFVESDDAFGQGVVIVNEVFARRYLADESPIGRRILYSDPWGKGQTEYEIVGVAGDVRFYGPAWPSAPALYFPHAQQPLREMHLLVKTSGDPLALAVTVRGEIAALGPNLPRERQVTLDQLLSDGTASRRFIMLLAGSFASVALILACLAVYGSLSISVTRRQREMGIRMALGSRPIDLCSLVLYQGMKGVLLGLGLGAAVSFNFSYLIEHLLFEITPTDPRVFLAAALILALIATIACTFPAQRAIKVDPCQVIRD